MTSQSSETSIKCNALPCLKAEHWFSGRSSTGFRGECETSQIQSGYSGIGLSRHGPFSKFKLNNKKYFMFEVSIFGIIGTIAASTMIIPQVIKTWQTKKARDISLTTISIILTSSASWDIYGFGKNDFYIMVSNAIIFVTALTLLFLKLKYKNK